MSTRDREWITCTVCDAEFKVVTSLNSNEILYCPFCGSDVVDDSIVEDDFEEDLFDE